MIKRRFYKVEHGDKDSGSDSSCFSSDSDPETEESEESESEDAVAEVSDDDDDDSGSEREGEYESSAAGIQSDDDADVDDDYNSGGDDYGGRLKKTSMNRKPDLEEPPEEEEENYILGCMIKRKSVHRCRYCPTTICLNEKTMQEHVSSKKHSRMEKLLKEGKLRTDDEEVDDPEIPSQEKHPEGNRRARRQHKRSQKQEKGSSTTEGENTDAMQKSRKKRRQTKD